MHPENRQRAQKRALTHRKCMLEPILPSTKLAMWNSLNPVDTLYFIEFQNLGNKSEITEENKSHWQVLRKSKVEIAETLKYVFCSVAPVFKKSRSFLKQN